MDLAIFLILLALVIFFFKRFSSFVYFVAIVDILLRILTFIKNNSVPELHDLINKYIPENVLDIVDNYVKTDNIVFTIISWLFVIIMCIFLFYSIRIFFKKK